MPALALVQFVFFLIWLTAGLPLRQLRHRQEVPPFVSHLIGGWVGELAFWLGERDVCHFERAASYVSLSVKFCPWRWTVSVSMLMGLFVLLLFWRVFVFLFYLHESFTLFLHIFCKNTKSQFKLAGELMIHFFFHSLIISNYLVCGLM